MLKLANSRDSASCTVPPDPYANLPPPVVGHWALPPPVSPPVSSSAPPGHPDRPRGRPSHGKRDGGTWVKKG